eukprot:210662-Chlamydomonas_euryale.AAC.2
MHPRYASKVSPHTCPMSSLFMFPLHLTHLTPETQRTHHSKSQSLSVAQRFSFHTTLLCMRAWTNSLALSAHIGMQAWLPAWERPLMQALASMCVQRPLAGQPQSVATPRHTPSRRSACACGWWTGGCGAARAIRTRGRRTLQCTPGSRRGRSHAEAPAPPPPPVLCSRAAWRRRSARRCGRVQGVLL